MRAWYVDRRNEPILDVRMMVSFACALVLVLAWLDGREHPETLPESHASPPLEPRPATRDKVIGFSLQPRLDVTTWSGSSRRRPRDHV